MTTECPLCNAVHTSMDALADHLTDEHNALDRLAEASQ